MTSIVSWLVPPPLLSPNSENVIDAVRTIVQRNGEATMDDIKQVMLENASWPKFLKEGTNVDIDFVSDSSAENVIKILGEHNAFAYNSSRQVLYPRRRTPAAVRSSSPVRVVSRSERGGVEYRYYDRKAPTNRQQVAQTRRVIEVEEEPEEVIIPPARNEVVIRRTPRVSEIYPTSQPKLKVEEVDLGLSEDELSS